MRRGEVWWYERPDRKRRPVLVLTRTEATDC
jgi:mRNA-degrading endonuclease toxin of MazEF toxin-antitoxin module